MDCPKLVVVCPNCHTPIEKGGVYCEKCKRLLVRQISGGEE